MLLLFVTVALSGLTMVDETSGGGTCYVTDAPPPPPPVAPPCTGAGAAGGRHGHRPGGDASTRSTPRRALYAIDLVFEEVGSEIPVMISGTIVDNSGRTLSGRRGGLLRQLHARAAPRGGAQLRPRHPGHAAAQRGDTLDRGGWH